MRVGLLGCAVQESFGGVNYVLNLARALGALPAGERPRITLFVDPWLPNQEAFEAIRPLADEIAPLSGSATTGQGPARRLVRILSRFAGGWAKAVLRAGRQAGCEILFPTSVSLGRRDAQAGPAWIGWAYDLQHVHHPEFFSRADRWRRDYYFAGLARHAPRIVVSSAAARADWLRRYPGTEDRVRVLSFTCVPLEEWYAGPPEAVAQAHGLPPKFLILPNQFWIHKNHATAFEAIRLLRERGLDVTLVCTGATHDSRHPGHFEGLRGWIEHHGLADCIRILGLLPAGEQMQLVRRAAALVQPSLFEGWSTVVEEARALGKPIFLSDLPVHREQDPPGARFFPPRDAQALADLIAAEWPALAPGSIPEQEAAARQAHAGRVARYAETFVRVAREAMSAA